MKTSHSVDITEERLNDVLSNIKQMLREVHEETFSAKMRQTMTDEFEFRARDMYQTFIRLISSTNHDNIFKSPYFIDWTTAVTKTYLGFPKLAEKVTIKMLAIIFGGDDALVRALITESKIDNADEVLNAQLRVWANDGEDAATIFKLLGLHLTDDKLIKSPLFHKWFEFTKSRWDDDAEAFVAMFPVLVDHLTGNELKRLLDKLDSLINTWANNGKDVVTIFELLGLHLTDGKLIESPFYSKWFAFARSRYHDDAKAFDAMFLVLADHLTGDELAKLLVVGLTLDRTKDVAKERLRELVKEWGDNGKDEASVSKHLKLLIRNWTIKKFMDDA